MNTESFRSRLEEELRAVESELETVGRKNPSVTDTRGVSDWEPTSGDFETLPAEDEERAEKFQELDNNEAVLNPLELRWRDIKRALQKIETGTYGKCEICDKEIEKERLEANPAARTCIEHLAEEKNLSL